MCSSLDRHSVILLGKKESGVSWSLAPPSSPNGRIPASRHVHSHVFRRGHVLGQRGGEGGGGGSTRKTEKEKDGGRGGFSCFQMEDTCVQIWAGWEKRHEQSTRTGGLDLGPRNRDKIDSVYVAGFLSGCRMCVLICINIFFFLLKSSPYGLSESFFGEFWKLNEEEQATLANM